MKLADEIGAMSIESGDKQQPMKNAKYIIPSQPSQLTMQSASPAQSIRSQISQPQQVSDIKKETESVNASDLDPFEYHELMAKKANKLQPQSDHKPLA